MCIRFLPRSNIPPYLTMVYCAKCMTRQRLIVLVLLACGLAGRAQGDSPVATELTQGVEAYQEERLMTALGHFIHVIEHEPSNKQAQTYIKLIVQKLQDRQVIRAHEEQVAILTATAKLLESRR